MTQSTTSEPTYRREIRWDAASGDYGLYINDELWGWARDHVEGEIVLDQIIRERMRHETVDGRLAWLSEQYRDAKAQGLDHFAAIIKRSAMDLFAQRLGVTVDELVAEYAAYKAEAA